MEITHEEDTGTTSLAQVRIDELDARFEELFAMEGEEGEDLATYKARISEIFTALLDDGTIVPDEKYDIDVEEVPEGCPQSTIDAGAAAAAHVEELILCTTMGPWLDARIVQVCQENGNRLQELIDEYTELTEVANEDGNALLEVAFGVLGTDSEDQETFNGRMRDEYIFNGPPAPAPSGLPVFADSCSPEDSAELLEATFVIEGYNLADSFITWLEGLAGEACNAFETENYTNQLAAGALIDKEAINEQLYSDWFTVCDDCAEDETEEEFRARIDQMFVDADVETQDSGIANNDYPESCLDFSDTIAQSQVDLGDFVEDYEECLTFFGWASPQVGFLQEEFCNAEIISLSAQTAMINMMIGDLASELLPAINDFLAATDPLNTDALEGQDYLEQVLAPQLLPAI
jgi:hypothetical protein